MTLEEIVEQLESCEYECEAGKLENNIAFWELKRLAEMLPKSLGRVLHLLDSDNLPSMETIVTVLAILSDIYSQIGEEIKDGDIVRNLVTGEYGVVHKIEGDNKEGVHKTNRGFLIRKLNEENRIVDIYSSTAYKILQRWEVVGKLPDGYVKTPDGIIRQSKVHQLKILPEYFEPVKNGLKLFEIRKNDRDYVVGDQLLLEEWTNDEHQAVQYTGRSVRALITYITDYKQKENYVVLGIKLLGGGENG